MLDRCSKEREAFPWGIVRANVGHSRQQELPRDPVRSQCACVSNGHQREASVKVGERNCRDSPIHRNLFEIHPADSEEGLMSMSFK